LPEVQWVLLAVEQVAVAEEQEASVRVDLLLHYALAG
jgi:hypothetical protein